MASEKGKRANDSFVTQLLFNNMDDILTSRKAGWFRQYSASVKEAGNVKGADSFDIYGQNSIKGADGFNKINTPDGTTLSEKLKNPAPDSAAENVRNALTEALKQTDAFKIAQKAFNSEVSHIPDLILAKPDRFHPGVIASTLLEIKGEAADAAKALQSHKKTELTNLFANEEFKTNFKECTGCSDAELDALKNEMLETLDKTHQEQLKKLEDSLNESANTLFEGLKKEFERVSFLGYWANRSASMKAEMLALAQQGAQKANDPAFIELNGETGDATLKNVSVRKLTKLKTLGGNAISINGNTFSITLKGYFKTKGSVYQELIGLAYALNAAGYDAIILNVSNSNPKKAAELGRRAYEAAVRAGFDLEKITINVNGETKLKYDDKGNLEKDELFKGMSQRLNTIKGVAQQIKENKEAQLKGDKDQVKKCRAELKAYEQEAAGADEPDEGADEPAGPDAPGGGGI